MKNYEDVLKSLQNEEERLENLESQLIKKNIQEYTKVWRLTQKIRLAIEILKEVQSYENPDFTSGLGL